MTTLPVSDLSAHQESEGRAANPIHPRQTLKDCLLLLLGASLYTLAAPPYEWDLAGWFALLPLFLVVVGKPPRYAFVAGLVYGVLFCLGMAYWVYFAVVSFFPLGVPLGALCTLVSYLVFIASYVGCATAGVAVLTRNAASPLCWLGVPALWVSAEFARSSLFSGFSWELLGYTQYRRLWLIQIADLTGVYGVSFLLAFSSYLVSAAVRSFFASRFPPPAFRFSPPTSPFPWLASACLLVMLSCTWRYGALRLRQGEQETAAPLTVALVRLNTPSTQRWQRVHYARVLLQYLSTTRQHLIGVQSDLIVWPEFALGFYLDRELSLRAQLSRLTTGLQTPLLVGAPRVEEAAQGSQYYNTAYLIAPNGAILGTYDKVRLLPFAEYRPLGVLPTFLPHSVEYPTEFTPGARSTIFPLGQTSFGVTICYEVTYPPLTRQLARDGARFLVNISNESWLAQGGAAAPAQHFSMSVFRAVETRRSLVRVATAGVSGVIDQVGRIQQVSTAQEGVLFGQVVPHSEQTVYTRHGDWFAIMCVGFATVALWSASWRYSRWGSSCAKA